MKPSPRREIASAVLLDNFGRFLLQQRDNITGILHPGKIGLFGGHREGEESYLQCVVREIHEEITHFVPPERFEHLVSFDGVDPEVEGGFVHAELFVVRSVQRDKLVITEGSLVIIKPDEIASKNSQLTPIARLAIKVFLKSEGRAEECFGAYESGT